MTPLFMPVPNHSSLVGVSEVSHSSMSLDLFDDLLNNTEFFRSCHADDRLLVCLSRFRLSYPLF
jgi:hypothetical protein